MSVVFDAPVSPAVQSQIHAVMRRFSAECFWNWDTSQVITNQAMARAVIRQLRLHGGKPGWRAAAELVRCL
jgi:hypothetical protein